MIERKRGQQMTIGTIIAILLGIFVLIFLIIGFTRGWNLFRGGIGVLEGDLEVAVQACSTYANAELNFNYCEFREYEIEEIDGFYNCAYIYSVATKAIPEGPGFSQRNCGTDGFSGAVAYCQNLANRNENNWQKTIVNGQYCGPAQGNILGWNVVPSIVP